MTTVTLVEIGVAASQGRIPTSCRPEAAELSASMGKIGRRWRLASQDFLRECLMKQLGTAGLTVSELGFGTSGLRGTPQDSIASWTKHPLRWHMRSSMPRNIGTTKQFEKSYLGL